MFRKRIAKVFTVLVTTVCLTSQMSAFAMEGGTEATGSVMLPTIKEEIISVDLPTVGDESPFDFYIDPQGLLYDTGAVRHGGGVVEEGAYLLFHNNSDGEYDFSRNSDRLSVTNRSTVPINVKITAMISNLGELRMDQDGKFDGEDDPAIYLAVVDDEGNECVLSEDGETSVEIELERAPSEAYTYRYDESTDSYEYVYQGNEDISFDSYSFGLRGECNANADWDGIRAYPRVTVTWSVNPIYSDREDVEEADEVEKEPMEKVDEMSEESVENEEDTERDKETDDVMEDASEDDIEDDAYDDVITEEDMEEQPLDVVPEDESEEFERL